MSGVHKQVIAYKDGKEVKTFESVMEASAWVGCKISNLSSHLHGRRPKTIHGYTFGVVEVRKYKLARKIGVLCYDEDGVLISKYNKTKDAAKAVGVSHWVISKAIRLGCKAGGYYWYREDDAPMPNSELWVDFCKWYTHQTEFTFPTSFLLYVRDVLTQINARA